MSGRAVEEIILEIERRIMELSKFIDHPNNKVVTINFELLLDWIKSEDKN